MNALPRIMTIDPSGAAARQTRAALELIARPAIHIDVPTPLEAVDMLNENNIDLLITALQLDDHMRGYELALRAKQMRPETSVIVLADEHDSQNIDDEARAAIAAADSVVNAGGIPFLYLRRPLDARKFVAAITAGLEGGDVSRVQFESNGDSSGGEVNGYQFGSVPPLDVRAATAIVDDLLSKVSAMAIVLSSRTGDVLVEQGAVGYIDRDALTEALKPSSQTTYEMGKLVGGRASALNFYDGESFDVFMLSVGIHYLLALIFDGAVGRSQFGAVNRYGRQAAQDLVEMIGAGAFMIEAEREARATMEMQRINQQAAAQIAQQQPPPAETPAKGRGGKRKTAEMSASELTAAALDNTPTDATLPSRSAMTAQSIEPIMMQTDEIEQAPKMEPIKDLDLSIFDADSLESLDLSAADMLFDMDALAEIANENRSERGPLTLEEAQQMGLMPSSDD